MTVINVTEPYVSGDNVTADNLNELVNDAEFTVDTTDNSTLEVHSAGYLKVKDDGIQAQHLKSDPNDTNDAQRAVTTNHIRNGNVTTAKIADNNVTFAKIEEMPARTFIGNSTGSSANPTAVPIDDLIADNAVTAAKISDTDTQFLVDDTSANKKVVVNEAGADVDFRVEGDTNANLINADAGADIVGIGVSINTSDTFDGSTTYKAQVKDGLRINNATGVAKLKLITDKSGGGGASITLKSTTPPVPNEGDYSIFIGGANGKFNIKNELAEETILMDADGDWYALTNTQDLGKTGNRWDNVWSAGTFNGSDRNIKQDIQDLDEVEKRVAVKCKGLIKKYRMKDAVTKKGNDARIHVGIIAQELQAAFESEGLDPFRYSMIGKDTWWEATDTEGNRDVKYEATVGYTEVTQMSVRYNELLAFIISVM